MRLSENAPTLVTGGAGFLGHHLVARLLADGRRVRVLDDLSTGARANLPDHPALELIEGSVLDEEVVRGAAEGCGLVFHLAGVVGMRLAVAERERAYATAVDGTRIVLRASGDAPAVLFSSSAVYGLTGERPVRERDATTPAGCLEYDGGDLGYASGKLELERIGREAIAAGRAVLMVRPFNVVGTGQTGRYGMVVPSFVKQALAGEPLVVYDDGAQARCFTEVCAFHDVLLRLVATPEAWRPDRCVINIGTDELTTIGTLARIVIEEAESVSEVEHVPYRAVFEKPDVRTRIPDTSRLLATVGPTSWPDIRSIVRDVVRERRRAATADRLAG